MATSGCSASSSHYQSKSLNLNLLSSSLRFVFPLFLFFLAFSSFLPSPVAFAASTENPERMATAANLPALLARAKVLVPRSNGAHKHTIVWLHGLGDSSAGFESLFKALAPPNTRVVLPNAPVRSITANGGMKMQGWYDIVTFDRARGLNHREDEKGIEESAALVAELLKHEATLVGGAEKIILGGFSQGAAMTLRVGLTHAEKLGGLISASGYLTLRQKFAQMLGPHAKTVPVLAYHGNDDQVVPQDFAAEGYEMLNKMGIKDNLRVIYEDSLEHSMSDDEFKEIVQFFQKVFQ